MGDQEGKLDKLYDKMQKIEQLLENMINDGKPYIVNVEKIDIQGPIVDKLEFTFDKIDIDEVSGALNIGNNLGVRVDGTNENKKVKPSDKQMKTKPSAPTGNEQTTKSDGKNETDKTKFSNIEKQIEEQLKEIFTKNMYQQGSIQESTESEHSHQSSVHENLKSTEDKENPSGSQTKKPTINQSGEEQEKESFQKSPEKQEKKVGQESKEKINENKQKKRTISADRPIKTSTYSSHIPSSNNKNKSSLKMIGNNKENNQTVENNIGMSRTSTGLSFKFTDMK